MSRSLALLAGASLLAAVTPAQVTRSGGGYLLRVKYTKGQTLRYSNVNVVRGATGQRSNVTITLPVVMRIADVKGTVATARITLGPSQGSVRILPNAQTVVVSLTNRNVAKGEGGGTSIAAQLPERPVKVGQTWTAEAPIASATGAVQRLNAVYRFQGVKQVGGRQVAVITYSVSGPANGSGTMTLLAQDGTLWTNESKLTVASGGTAPLTVTSTIKRA